MSGLGKCRPVTEARVEVGGGGGGNTNKTWRQIRLYG